MGILKATTVETTETVFCETCQKRVPLTCLTYNNPKDPNERLFLYTADCHGDGYGLEATAAQWAERGVEATFGTLK